MDTKQKTWTKYLEEALEIALDVWADGERQPLKSASRIARLVFPNCTSPGEIVRRQELECATHQQFVVWAEEEAE